MTMVTVRPWNKENERFSRYSKRAQHLYLNFACAKTNSMIQLTRLNRQPLAVNSDLIKFVEQAHDTVITLIGGEKIVVMESASQVMERIIEFRQKILAGLSGVWVSPLAHTPPAKGKPEDDDNH